MRRSSPSSCMRCSSAATRSRNASLAMLTNSCAAKSLSISSRGQPLTKGSRSPIAAYSGLLRGTDISLAVDDDEPPARPQHPNPLVHRPLRVRQCPQEVPADGDIEAGGSKGQLLCVGLFEADPGLALRRLLPRLRDHQWREIDTGDPVSTGREFETQKAGAAADVESVERVGGRQHQI